ncbi:unnamed protein product [Rotaria magnacalcarata]|uniref:C2 domain-containing protein n=4 Tax=Rotaria magnacalcarata TaxID=392030 RepID=A0A816WC71_9BILA|nr:unnamed protein product [Rotaria magnacalcarata]CAF1532463.1 unnamed protein product [Rotaria magnacalcarata]CAF2077815.1 unnamed protein product [Rotaria magnacalcarata]CAF2130919.1 unnamed protein product [Rotaria magnacalcarata]CAF2202068.1 unnamed protein product [Rotaria magnacalcarata]
MSSPTSTASLLLCVLVKSGKIQALDNECYSYVILKIDNVKSTTSVVKGQQPKWEQEFYFDVPDRSTGLQIELWERGPFRDKLLGLCHISLNRNDNLDIINIKSNENIINGNERWINLDSESILNRQGQVTRTCNPTKHSLLIHTYVELPSDLTEEESKELTEKLEILREILDKEGRQLQDVTLNEINSLSAMHFDQQSLQYQQLSHQSHSHFSDDSDYTSDVSYPINTQANLNYPVSSMSQSNIDASTNENISSSTSTKKPLAFVQPVMRDLNSVPNASRRLNQNQMQNTMPLVEQEPLSYISQPRKLPMNKIANFNQDDRKHQKYY